MFLLPGTKRNPVGEWRTLPPMSIARSYAAAAAYDNLYARTLRFR